MRAMKKKDRFLNLWIFDFLSDFAAIVVSYYFAVWFRFDTGLGAELFSVVTRTVPDPFAGSVISGYMHFYMISAPRIVATLTVTICFLYAMCGMYENRRFIRRRPVGWYVIVSNVSALAVFYTYFHLTKNIFHPRSIFVLFAMSNVVLCMVLRSTMQSFLRGLRTRTGLDRWNAVMLGDGKEAEVIKELVDARHPRGIVISGHKRVDGREAGGPEVDQLINEIGSNSEDMVISVDKELSTAQIMEILRKAGNEGIAVKILSPRLDVIVSRAGIPADLINGYPLVHFDLPKHRRIVNWTRRAVDVLVSASVLVLLAPFLAAIAIAVKVTSKGPVFFSQQRIGVNRRPFTIYKFRSMYEEADEMQAEVEEFNESGEGLFKIREDPRVTPVGRFLRRLSLDELPQLVNVLKGEMTLVGPRPLPRRDFENYYEDWHYSRHEGLPGLTCLWQVSGRSDVSFHDMCVLDVYYLRNRNWVLDLKIILRTFWVVLFAKGAY
jgi:exopolysaccharide biosynthesis polyprenyl glycosylphosphotransferase